MYENRPIHRWTDDTLRTLVAAEVKRRERNRKKRAAAESNAADATSAGPLFEAADVKAR